MTGLDAPTLSLLLGEGSGGGALALLPADRVIAAQHAWLAPIAPEGASAILYRSSDQPPALASAQATSSTALQRLGIVDVVIPDRPGEGEEGERFAERIAATAARELSNLLETDPDERRRVRASRYRPFHG
jgi:acyl-CoA carboxylase subunit beta